MTEPFQAEDLLLYQSITEVAACPIAKQISCSIESVDKEKDLTVSKLWNVPLDGGQPRQITTGPSNDIQPAWSPDGSQLGFISDRAGTNQVFTLPRDGGEAQQATWLNVPVVFFQWHPDGQTLVVIASLPVDSSLRGARPRGDTPAPPDDAPQVVWKIPYKVDGIGYTLDRESHVFTVNVGSGESQRLTDGPFDVRSASWSPDGKQIAYVRTRENDKSHRTDVWVMSADGSNARQLTSAQSQTMYPVWSPDGRWIVFSGTIDEGDAQVRLWLIDMSTRNIDPLGDESIEISTESQSVQFDGQPGVVLAVVACRGVQNVAEISIPDGKLRWITNGDRHVSRLACCGDRLVYTSETPIHAAELYSCARDGGDERKLSQFNGWWLDRHAATMERRSFSVPDGAGSSEMVDGWLIRPTGIQGPTPLLVDVHGGPASYVLFQYPPAAYWSTMWSQGWSILALNAVGSASYGRQFCDRLHGRWGDLDLPQHLAAVHQLQNEGLVTEKIAIAGKSYGGFMAGWATSHIDEFRAAIVMAPVADIPAHMLTSDSGFYSDPYAMGGNSDRSIEDVAWSLSPIKHAGSVKTPTLILQGENDERCPRGQAESFFIALKRGLNPPAELVIYPGANHKFTEQAKPSHRVDVMQRIKEWLLRWAC